MKKYRDADRFEPVPCQRCGGSGLEPSLTDVPAEVAGRSHLADLGRQIAANPEARRHASAALAALVGEVPPTGRSVTSRRSSARARHEPSRLSCSGRSAMPYVVTADATGCDGWAVVKSDTREVVGCHATDAEAERQQLALYARERIGKGMSRRTVSVGTMQLREMERGPDGWWRPRKRDEEEPGAVERVVEVIFDAGGGEELPVDVVDAGDAEEAPGDVVDEQAATMRLRARAAAARARISGAGRRVFVLADRQDRALVATLARQARAAAQHRAVERVSRREA